MNTVNTEFSFVEEKLLVNHLKLNQNVKMKYSTEPKCRKYVKGCGFLSFGKKIWR